MAHKKARNRAPYKARYAAYSTLSKYSKNKRAQLESHLKAHPEDKQAIKALKDVKVYKRAASKSSGLSSVDKRYAQLKAASRRAMNAILYQEKTFPKDPNDMDSRIMATLNVEDWPNALRKKHRSKPEPKGTKEVSKA